MALAPSRNLARGEILPSYFEDRESRHTANLASNFRLQILAGTTNQLVVHAASTNGEAAVVSIANLPRYVESDVTTAALTGSAGTYDVYVTCANDTISSTPAPNTDNTVYTFGLVIRAAASPPTGVDQYRKVGTCEWSGTAITQVNQLVGDTQPYQSLAPTSTIDGETPLRVFGSSSSQSAALIRAFKNSGGTEVLTLAAAGGLSLPVTGSGAGLSVGAASGVYESVSGHLAVKSTNVLDLSAGGATDASTGATTGDKVSLLGSSSGFGFGVQSARLVAYMPVSAALAVRVTSGSGARSSGSDVLTLSAAGVAAVGNGTALLPSLTFVSDPDTGFYRLGANNLAITTGGTAAASFSSGSMGIANSLNISGASGADSLLSQVQHLASTSGIGGDGGAALTALSGDGQATTGSTGQTGGKGGGVLLVAGNGGTAPSGSTNGDGGDILLTPGAAGASVLGSPGVAGSVVVGDVATRVGFFGSHGTTKNTVTGSKAGNAALGSLLLALSNYGIIVNSST